MRFASADARILIPAFFAATFLLGTGDLHPVRGQSAENAQTPKESSARETNLLQGGAGYFAAGLHFPGLQLPGRSAARLLSVGGSGYGIVGGRLLVGGAGHRLLASGGGFSRNGASAGGNYGLFTVGYLFRPAAQVRVYPQLGFGAGNLDVDIEQGTQRFGEALIDPARGASFEKRTYLVRLGGGLEYRIGTSGGGDLLVGLQIGYLFSPGESVDTNGNVADGLEASMQGPFFRLTFGGGS